MKKIWMLIILLTTVVTGLASCNDDDNDNDGKSASPIISDNYTDLPLPIAKQYLFMDAISWGSGTSISVGEYEGETIHNMYHPLMSSYGYVYNNQGVRLFNVQYPDGTNWKQVLVSPLTAEWEKCYPGGYQLFKLHRQYIQTISSSKKWDGNKNLNDLPEWLAEKIQTCESDGTIPQCFVYQGIWNNESVYFLDYINYDPLFDVFTADGKAYQWNDNLELLNFVQHSYQWQLLYVIYRD